MLRISKRVVNPLWNSPDYSETYRDSRAFRGNACSRKHVRLTVIREENRRVPFPGPLVRFDAQERTIERRVFQVPAEPCACSCSPGTGKLSTALPGWTGFDLKRALPPHSLELRRGMARSRKQGPENCKVRPSLAQKTFGLGAARQTRAT